MITITFSEAKNLFLDRALLLSKADRARAGSLRRGALVLRAIARRSMRRRKKASKPGDPPSARTDRKYGGQLRDKLLAVYDPSTRSALAGPVALRSGKATVPPLLERGGPIEAVRRRVRRVGGSGPIEIVRGNRGKPIRGDREGRRAVYAKLRTPSQAARSNALEEAIYGRRSGRIAPRPYMKPALDKALPRIPEQFRDSITRSS